MSRTKKSDSAATPVAPEAPASELAAAVERPAPIKKEAWFSFAKEQPPKKERFVYCRELDSGTRVAAFAEVSESADGPGLFVDGLSGIQPIPATEGHWWKVIELPA